MDQAVANSEAQNVVNSAMQARGIIGYTSSIRVLLILLEARFPDFHPVQFAWALD
jgi:hypothetical protein